MMTHANYLIFDNDNNCEFGDYFSYAHQQAYTRCLSTQKPCYVLCLHDLHINTYKFNFKTKIVEIE